MLPSPRPPGRGRPGGALVATASYLPGYPDDPGDPARVPVQRALVAVLVLFPYLQHRFMAAFSARRRGEQAAVDASTLALAPTVVALVSGVALLAGFAPPPVLRMLWRSREEDNSALVKKALVEASSVADIAAPCTNYASRLFGGRGAVLVGAEGALLGMHGLTPREAHELTVRVSERATGGVGDPAAMTARECSPCPAGRRHRPDRRFAADERHRRGRGDGCAGQAPGAHGLHRRPGLLLLAATARRGGGQVARRPPAPSSQVLAGISPGPAARRGPRSRRPCG